MALVYYPKNQVIALRDTVSSSYEQLVLAASPNTVLYFDSGSGINAISASNLEITSSWSMYAVTTSLALVSVTGTASYAETASVALNAAPSISASWASSSLSASIALTASSIPSTFFYTTIATSSLRWITASYLIPEQFVEIGVSASYNFTCSDVPSAGQVSTVTLYISNSAPFTSSLSFPSDWVFMGSVPTYISTSRAAVLSLKNYGGALNVAAFTVQY